MLQLLSGVPLHCSLGVGLILINKVEEYLKEYDKQVLHETADNSTKPEVKKAFDEKFNAEIAVSAAEEAVKAVTDEVAEHEGHLEFIKAMEPGVDKRRGKAKATGDQWRAK